MTNNIEPLNIVASSQTSITLRTADRDGPIVVSLERAAIDDCFALTASTDSLRRRIADANLDALTDVVATRVARGKWTLRANSGDRQIVLRIEDLRDVDLQNPV